jgi:hypothetical protein
VSEIPLVSVVTPSYNSARFLGRTVRSVQQQDYPRIEHIVIDGGSSDGTVDVLHGNPHLRWISEPDQGQSDALNKGFRMANGEIIGWLNADDTYNPRAVAEAVNYLDRHPEATAVFSRCNVIDEHDHVHYVLGAPPFSLAGDLLEHRVPQPATFMRRAALEAVGYLDPQLHYVMDRDLFMKLGYHGRLDNVDAIWANFRECEGTKTISYPERFWLETLQVFDRFFTLPDLPGAVLAVKAHAYARAYWMAGILCQTHPDDPTTCAAGRRYCASALTSYPLLAEDLDFASEQLTHWAVTRVEGNFREQYLRSVLEPLELSERERRRVTRRVLGHLYAALSLTQAGTERGAPDRDLRRQWLWKAIRYDPRWLRNQGIQSHILREGIGLPRRSAQ